MAQINIPEFLTPEDVSTGDEIEIQSEAEEVHITGKDGRTTTKWQLEVKLPNGQIRTWTANKTSAISLKKRFGQEMMAWIGKKFRVQKVPTKIAGVDKEVLYVLTEQPKTQRKIE